MKSLSYRFEHSGNKQDISEAIQHQQHAIQLTPKGHTDLPKWLNSLGNSYLYCFKHTQNIHDISEAIQYQQQAIQLTSEGHANFPVQLNNLGSSLLQTHWKCAGYFTCNPTSSTCYSIDSRGTC